MRLHLSCGTMCPWGGVLMDGWHRDPSLRRLVCHCPLIETDQHGLVLADTGIGTRDVRAPRPHPGWFFLLLNGIQLRWESVYAPLCLAACVGLLAGVTPSGAAAAEFRVEAGLGIAHGDHDLAYSRDLGTVGLSVESESALNGSGIAVTAGAWVDGLLFKDLSLGLEYLHIENSADLDLAVEALAETVSVDSGADLDMNALMLNAAWRRNRGTIHPYVALGAGVVRLEGRIDNDVAITAGISELRLLDFSDSAYAPAGQVVSGFDYDVSERIYVGAAARYFLFDGRLFGRDEVTRELAATVKLGIAF